MSSVFRKCKITTIPSETDQVAFDDVYELAFKITQRDFRSTIINIGGLNSGLLRSYAEPFNVINISKSKIDKVPQGFHLENIYMDEDRLPVFTDETLDTSVVVCVVTDEIARSRKALNYLVKLSQRADYMLMAYRIQPGCLLQQRAALEHRGFEGIFGLTRGDSIAKDSLLYIGGNRVRYSAGSGPKKVLAVMTAYNEDDIIKSSVEHLLNQGIDVHIIDNWSNDGTYETIKKISTQNKGIVSYERYPQEKPQKHVYKWEDLLSRVQTIAANSDYDWVMHNDADELRVSPWQNVKFVDAIGFIDRLGYNALDLTVADFRPVKDGFRQTSDIDEYLKYFELSDKGGYFTQIKCWKNTTPVDLVRTGGHHAEFEGQKIYPIKFFTKHFPIRSTNQGNKKIFQDRKKVFDRKERQKGWHIQYDEYEKEREFIWNPLDLYKMSGTELPADLVIERLSGVGIGKRSME